ncbi:MAG: hypothetical protein HY012_01570 [Acidobacteria bacterium]|nr:hypothetical protein [Acidobacteriota bacterium]
MDTKTKAAALAWLLLAGPALAQPGPPTTSTQASTAAQAQPPSDSDPTQSVFLSVRNEYFNLRGDNWTNASILRMDRAWLKQRGFLGDKVGILTRFDLPVVTTHAGGQTHAGLGDLYTQAVWLPWLSPRFALAMGSGITIPTATHATLGRGKWQIAPLLAPVWFFPRGKGFAFVRLHQFSSFAGNGNRTDVNYLLVAPTLLYRFHRRWWVLVDTEIKTDWEFDNRRAYRSGFEIGHVVNPRFALAVRSEIPWGKNREGDWTLKIILTRYRLKK